MWEAFSEYRLNALSLSASEVSFLKLLSSKGPLETVNGMQEAGWLKQREEGWKPNREALEFAAKLERFGMMAPWI